MQKRTQKVKKNQIKLSKYKRELIKSSQSKFIQR
jgi:hypothetical protein